MYCTDDENRVDVAMINRLNNRRVRQTGLCIRMHMETEDGMTWAKDIVEDLPPREEGEDAYRYVLLRPGEKRFSHFITFTKNPDCRETADCPRFIRWLGWQNPTLAGMRMSAEVVDLDKKNRRTVLRLRVLTSDLHILSALDNTVLYGWERIKLLADTTTDGALSMTVLSLPGPLHPPPPAAAWCCPGSMPQHRHLSHSCHHPVHSYRRRRLHS